MTRAVLSLGSNLGDRIGYLRQAVAGLGGAVLAISAVYETRPWGVTDQPDFLNAVCVVADPELDHWAWLRWAQRLEQLACRVRERRWGPRTLDVDVVTVDGIRSEDPELLLPHPGAASRATVLIPWLDADPGAWLSGYGAVTDLLDGLDEADREAVRRRDDLRLV
ncbi:2-amino-4-hydroxy-6-hydroxymethyldihydropteridine diphosphokinase [Haloechinothrix sp. LS1_15]|uniref:2-amino-4-hydroxy-6- hydroxymethyldihydropteridine diphosphokinase n=1 Tax=Haloechinothrix sp. LS1_15 TaxID=2652248 RepID=UPI002945F5BE|nr:2-amino-4-hydroxy-6-hydroxymethyldihydropteridine diphosphokinase [Haloechinothrix sp. LS1_15]MDV6011426.1 2-amino-4-hydroxy-6-hydroxymethyldihydropteridine diphosphokinase [Haloechinothrix sp. LS1_15]